MGSVSMADLVLLIFNVALALAFVIFTMFIGAFIGGFTQRHNAVAATDHIPFLAAAATSVFVALDVFAPAIHSAVAATASDIMFIILVAFIKITGMWVVNIVRQRAEDAVAAAHGDSVVIAVERLLKIQQTGWLAAVKE